MTLVIMVVTRTMEKILRNFLLQFYNFYAHDVLQKEEREGERERKLGTERGGE